MDCLNAICNPGGYRCPSDALGVKRPDFSCEKRLWQKDYRLVIGVDEVGRGSFAGPVVAGAASLKPPKKLKLLTSISGLGIDDSKKLSPPKRQALEEKIKKYFFWGIGEGSVAEIDRLGIVKATEKAMRRAIKNLIVKSTKFESRNSKQYQNDNNNCHPELVSGSPRRCRNEFGMTLCINLLCNSDLGFPKRTPFVLVDAFHVKYIPHVGLKNQKAIIHGDQKSISIAAASILAKVYRDTLMQKLALRYRKYHWEKNKGYGTKKHREILKRYGAIKLHRKSFVKNWIPVLSPSQRKQFNNVTI